MRDVAFEVRNHGTEFLIRPNTDRGFDWCQHAMVEEFTDELYDTVGEGPQFSVSPQRFTELLKRAEKAKMT